MDDLVFLFDVDNTLLDNDAVQADLRAHLAQDFGDGAEQRYWAIFEELRTELGYADYLGALERYRLEDLHDPRLLRMSSWLVDYPFAERLYPGAIDAVRRVAEWGPAVVLSDGDAVFQPRKVVQSGIWKAFDDRGPDLCPQGAGTGRRRAALSREALRPYRRQAAHPRRGEGALGPPSY